jgi:hypothetical protein
MWHDDFIALVCSTSGTINPGSNLRVKMKMGNSAFGRILLLHQLFFPASSLIIHCVVTNYFGGTRRHLSTNTTKFSAKSKRKLSRLYNELIRRDPIYM